MDWNSTKLGLAGREIWYLQEQDKKLIGQLVG